MSLASADLRFWLQTAAYIALALAAWRWGGGPERALAGIFVWFGAADLANHAMFGAWSDLYTINTGHVVIDLAALVVAVGVAALANRFYPLWFAACQLVAVIAHLAREMAEGINPLAYVVMYVGPSYCQIIILALGIWWHRRRVLREGTYRAWRNSSHRSRATARMNSPNG